MSKFLFPIIFVWIETAKSGGFCFLMVGANLEPVKGLAVVAKRIFAIFQQYLGFVGFFDFFWLSADLTI